MSVDLSICTPTVEVRRGRDRKVGGVEGCAAGAELVCAKRVERRRVSRYCEPGYRSNGNVSPQRGWVYRPEASVAVSSAPASASARLCGGCDEEGDYEVRLDSDGSRCPLQRPRTGSLRSGRRPRSQAVPLTSRCPSNDLREQTRVAQVFDVSDRVFVRHGPSSYPEVCAAGCQFLYLHAGGSRP